MIISRVIPCLLLKGEGLVKTINFKKPVYVGDPINTLKLFNDKETDEIIFLDINASKEHYPPRMDVIRDIASECFMPLCYGGGITTVQQMEDIFYLGVEKISINVSALTNPELITKAAEIFGNQSIVVAVDVKKDFWGKYRIYNHTTGKTDIRSLTDWITQAIDAGAGEILLNSVDREGTYKGYDLELIRKVSEISSVPVIALGGANGPENLKEAVQKGKASAVAAGSLFVFQGKHRAVLINYPTPTEVENIFH